jgi:hypothetical protein
MALYEVSAEADNDLFEIWRRTARDSVDTSVNERVRE